MTKTVVDRTVDIGVSTLTAVASALREAFGIPFDFWVLADRWRHVSPAGETLEAVDPTPEFATLLDRFSAGDPEPRVVRRPDGCPILMVPVCLDHQALVIASATIEQSHPESLVKFAQLFRLWFSHQQEIDHLRCESESFVNQVTDDFEELCFLRRIADYLEVSDMSCGLIQMAKFVLPLLIKTVKAESLLFVSAEGDGSLEKERAGAVRPAFRVGSCLLDDAAAVRFVERYRGQAENSPFVKNDYQDTPDGEDFPGVRDFVLIPVGASGGALGWIAALNRQAPPPLNSGTPDPQLGSDEFGSAEASLLTTSASILAAYGRNYGLLREKEKLLVNMVRVMVSAIEAKDPYTCGHSERVALFAQCLAKELDMSSEESDRLYLTGLLHDIGKIGVPDAILGKQAALTDEEYDKIKRHPDLGWKILHDLEQLRYVLPGVLYHHEHYDGSGYPEGLAGNDIPLDGRILAVADTYDATTSSRPYRQGLPEDTVFDIFREGAGTQWDPEIVDALSRALPEFHWIRRSYERPLQPRREMHCETSQPETEKPV